MLCYLRSRMDKKFDLESLKSSMITSIHNGLQPLKQLFPSKKTKNSLWKYTMLMMELLSMISQNKISLDHINLPCIRLSLAKIKLLKNNLKIPKKISEEKSELQGKKRKMALANSHAALMYLQTLKELLLFSLPLAKPMKQGNSSQSTKASAEKQVLTMASIGLPFIQTPILWLIPRRTEQFSLNFFHITQMETTNL